MLLQLLAHIFLLSNLSKIEQVALVANLGETFLTKVTTRSIGASLPKLVITLPKVLRRKPLG